MKRKLGAFVAMGGLLMAAAANTAIHEEATVFAEGPMMGVFNNLVIYDQHVPQSSLESIVPDLATAWSWSEDGTELTCCRAMIPTCRRTARKPDKSCTPLAMAPITTSRSK